MLVAGLTLLFVEFGRVNSRQLVEHRLNRDEDRPRRGFRAVSYTTRVSGL